jgi:uncharacterized membrane protein
MIDARDVWRSCPSPVKKEETGGAKRPGPLEDDPLGRFTARLSVPRARGAESRREWEAGDSRRAAAAAERGAFMERNNGFVNVGESERWASLIGGAFLGLWGIKNKSAGGALAAVLGGVLAYRGATGHCPVYERLGRNGTDQARRSKGGIKIAESVVVHRPAAELYRAWRDFSNLPSIMRHLESVENLDGRRSRWRAKGPLGTLVEWDAEIVRDFEGELITWQSLEDSDVVNAGSVSFIPVRGGRATEVKVILRYDPPGKALGAALATLLGENPSRQVREDLLRFKERMEAGETQSAAGGRSSDAGAS